jgi:predicted sulfurtransferase
MKNYRALLFYKYVDVDNLEEIVNEHLQWCLANDIKGRVFFAKEGVNCTVSGNIENIKKYKNKTVVTYCTGGIRCEKASAYLVEQGFSDVYQLEGGIYNYII